MHGLLSGLSSDHDGSRLQGNDGVNQVFGLLYLRGDLGVDVLAKSLGSLISWELSDLLLVKERRDLSLLVDRLDVVVLADHFHGNDIGQGRVSQLVVIFSDYFILEQVVSVDVQ